MKKRGEGERDKEEEEGEKVVNREERVEDLQ